MARRRNRYCAPPRELPCLLPRVPAPDAILGVRGASLLANSLGRWARDRSDAQSSATRGLRATPAGGCWGSSNPRLGRPTLGYQRLRVASLVSARRRRCPPLPTRPRPVPAPAEETVSRGPFP